MTKEQGKHVYKKIESGSIINTDTLHQEIEQERQLNRIDETNGGTNSYKELIVNKAEKIEPLLTQMEQLSILSNTLNYIQYDRYPKYYHSLGISAVNRCGKNLTTKEGGKRYIRVRFWSNTGEYLDVYEGIWSEILSTTRFDGNSDLSSTHLGKAD